VNKSQAPARALARLEVHEHHFISGPNANKTWLSKFEHSHEGGDKPHEHADAAHRTGPGAYTIDKDEWFERTGLRGGGRKKYASKPTGPQLPLVSVDAPRMRVVIVGDGGAAAARGASGAGFGAVHRMVLALGAKVESVTHHPGGGGAARRSA
jgi:hypothetical protein